MKFWKIVLRSFMLLILVFSATCLSLYEYDNIRQKERDRQYVVYNEAKDEISLNLKMAKIAILTKDLNMYHESTAKIDSAIEKINSYQIIREEQSEYVNEIADYNNLLKEREESLREMKELDDQVGAIREELGSKYGDAKKLSRDSLKGASKTIKDMEVNIEDYSEDSVRPVAETINKVLTKMNDLSSKLSNCIDKCYKEDIKKISTDASNSLGKVVESFPGQNKDFISQFQLERLDELTKK